MTVKPIPDGYNSLTPYMVVDGAAKCIEFLKKAFNATDAHACMMHGDKIVHAELKIGDSKIMIADAQPPQHPAHATKLYYYVENVDQVYKRALECGGKSLSEPADMFYGDRHGAVIDPCGNEWWIATRIENLTDEEMRRRGEEFKKKQMAGSSKS